ncbi:MAG: PepSY domain-containing protein [Steroidobacteraceae bacterium]
MKIKSGPMTAALLAASSLLAMGAAQATDTARHEAQSMDKAKMSLTEAIHMAERQGNGQAISAEYEFKNGNPAYYEVKVLGNDGKKLTKYELDPNTGQVKEVSDEKFEKLFTRIKPTAIQHAPTSLTRAITTAETRSGGKAREAEVNRDGDQLQYEVKVVKADGTSETVKINGADGKVASAK